VQQRVIKDGWGFRATVVFALQGDGPRKSTYKAPTQAGETVRSGDATQ